MAIKRTSLRGKGASIFFGDDEELTQSDELSNSETVEPTPTVPPQPPRRDESAARTSGLPEPQGRRVDPVESSERRVAKSETGRVVEPSTSPPRRDRVSESQSRRVADLDSFDDRNRDTMLRPAPDSATSRLPYSGTSQASNSLTRGAARPQSEAAAASRQNLHSSTVANSRASRVDDFDPAARRREPQRGSSIADETRAEYRVAPDEDERSYPSARQMSFSEFYSSGESHYLMLEPLATRLTTEQMDRLSKLERRIHQGRRRKEPRVTKNSIIRALLEATFDLDLDTRDINSEMELVNRFREALHLASLVREAQD
jgi:hypothetical protein